MLKDVQEVQKEIDKLNSDIIDYTNSIAESYQNLFDQVAQNSENTLSIYSHFTNAYNNEIDLAEAKGLATSKKHYEALQKIEKANFDESKKLAEDLQKSLNDALASGYIKRGSQAWYDMTERINEAKEAIDKAAISMQNYSNQIREIDWDRFDTLQDKISDAIDEAEFLIDLMSNEELYNEDGSLNNLGISTAGLYAQNYDTYMNQVKRYADEIANINNEIANDPNNLTLIERRKELLKLQRDAILSAQKEKESIKSLVEDGVKEQINYLDDLIDKYLDALSSQKDLYDYQKKVNDQTSKIASLQKQLSAFGNDTSEEARQKIQKIQVSLKDAQDNLRDTEYNKYVSDSKKMLNDLKDDFKEAMDARLDNIDALVEDVSNTVDGNSKLIMDTLTEQSEAVGYTITENITDVWNNERDVLSSTNQMIGNIHETLVKIWEYADANARRDVQSVSDDHAAKQASEKAAELKAQSKSTTGTSASKTTSTSTSASKTSTASKTTTAAKKTPSSTYTGLFKDGNDTYYYVKGKKQTGWKNMNAGKRYFSTKNGKMLTGEQWIGGKTYYFDKSTGVMRTGTFTVGDTTYQVDKNGVIIFKGKRNTSNIKTSGALSGIGSLQSSIRGYATGSRNISRNQIGWTNERGQELLYRKNSGAIMTPLNSGDKVFTSDMTENLWNMSRSGGLENLVKNIIHGDRLASDYGSLRSALSSVGHSGVQQNFDNITFNLPNVTDYKSFIKQMQTDKKFEQFIQAMTIGRINGKPKDMKRHINF